MRDQILSQPAALRGLLARRDEITARVASAGGQVRRIWAAGHGDSYFAPLAASAAFRRWVDLPYMPVLSQELAAYPPAGLNAEALVIILSMSGGVGRSIAAAETARARGAGVLGITNAPESRLAQVADETFALNIVEPAPFLAGTVTFTASVLSLLMVAGILAETGTADRAQPGATFQSAVESAIDAIEVALALEGSVREEVGRFAQSSPWYFLGMDGHVATAQYGAAKLVEVADTLAMAHETEEFFHEHHWVVGPDQAVVVLAHDAPSERRAAAAIAHLTELRVPVWLVGQGSPAAGVHHASIGPVEPWCAMLPGAVAVQWIAYWLSRAKGLDPDRRTHLRDSLRYHVSRKYR